MGDHPSISGSIDAQSMLSMSTCRQSHHQSEDVETENMNPQDIFDSIKQTSADIQLLSLGSKLGTAGDDIKKREDFAFQDSGNQEIRNDSPDGPYSRRNVQQSSQAALSRPEVNVGSLLLLAIWMCGDSCYDSLSDGNRQTQLLSIR